MACFGIGEMVINDLEEFLDVVQIATFESNIGQMASQSSSDWNGRKSHFGVGKV